MVMEKEKVVLTRGERQVAKELLIHDFNFNEVSKYLNLTKEAIYFHCKNIRAKMECDKTYLAIKKAEQKGLID